MSGIFFRSEHKMSWLALVMGCFLSVGCGPIYDTVDNFIPPATSQGKICANNCESQKMMCEQLADQKKENCELRGEQACKNKKDCDKPYCSADYSKCERSYKTCYKSCGGKVESKRICVMGCD
ncbi:MAG: hypothetical protein KAI83_00895 [Thiomargarita sp.]|nr:hypothetical protein [Thiomargarita sp.]